MRLVTKIVGETNVVMMVGEARSKRSQVVIQRAAKKPTVELKKGGAVVEIQSLAEGPSFHDTGRVMSDQGGARGMLE
ncbi:hypothetical protein ROHU_032119 [Labeo rohita]|uniref:Uncharacterized protein n=1 Tax=Labeo rohita TaxID=84645 RepID=A0A498LQQ6_LABRO|nr:hypothetical protein ROHU_032119 [Labeo rohita]